MVVCPGNFVNWKISEVLCSVFVLDPIFTLIYTFSIPVTRSPAELEALLPGSGVSPNP